MDSANETAHTSHATSRSLLQQVREGARHIEIQGLTGSCDAFLLAALLRETTDPLYILTPDESSAERLAGDLAFYWERPEQICLFPQWEVTPFEPLSPHPEVEARRIATLAAMLEGSAR